MRTIICAALLGAALISPAAAPAVDFESVAGVADCNGWRVEARIFYMDWDRDVDLRYTLELVDAEGQIVQSFTHAQEMVVAAGQSVDYAWEGQFDATPGDGWLVRGEFVLLEIVPDLVNEITAPVTMTVACDSDAGAPAPFDCARPPVWWADHPEAWPVDQVRVGDDMLDAEQIAVLLNYGPWGHPARLLARHVVAARFNALVLPAGSADHLTEVLAEADRLLTDYPALPRRGIGRFRRSRTPLTPHEFRNVAMPLIFFNWPDCAVEEYLPRGGRGQAEAFVEQAEALLKAVPEQNVSFGAAKAIYR